MAAAAVFRPHPFRPWRVLSPDFVTREPSGEMAEVVIDLPEGLAEAIEQRATALGTTADQWLSLVIADVVADVPEEGGDGPDAWICR